MAFYNPSNQLLQIDTGSVATFLYNPTLQPIVAYRGIGENQILGQRYFGVSNSSLANPSGAPAIFMLVQYLATSATVDGQLPAAPAPVYWTDQTYTTVTGISTESLLGLNGIAGYMRVNTTSLTTLTAAQLKGAQILVQVAGYLAGAVSPASTVAGDSIIGAAGAFTNARIAAGTAPTYRTLGIAATAVAAGLSDMLVNCDII